MAVSSARLQSHRAGALRCRIALQKPIVTYDTYGSPTETYTTVQSCWAYVYMSGAPRETETGQSATAIMTYWFVMRDIREIKPNWRISYDNRTFEIIGFNNSEQRNRWWEIVAREVLD